MTSIRNLPLAVRLGGAFGVVCLALTIVAFTGVHAMSGLRAKTDELGERHLAAAQLLGGMQTRAKDNVSLIAQHLYVRDGDLAAQDGIFKDIEANWAKNAAAGAKLDKLFAGTSASDEYATFVTTRADMVKLQKQVLTDSRAETLRNDEERATSRDAFEKQVLEADTNLEAAGEALSAATNKFAEQGMREAHAADAGGKRLIIGLALAAILAAIALAVWVTRSVVKPVKALGTRLTSLDEHCLTGLGAGLDAVANGDLSQDLEPGTTPVEVNSTDELGQLSTTFNSMLSKAQGAHRVLQRDAHEPQRDDHRGRRAAPAPCPPPRSRWRRPPRRPAAPSTRSPPP